MSYRALITVLAENGTRPPTASHHKCMLGGSFDYAETLIHSTLRVSFGKAESFREEIEEVVGVHSFETVEDRASWVKEWADQEWIVLFRTAGEFTTVTITGKNAVSDDIFMRRTTYHTPKGWVTSTWLGK